MRGSRLDMTLQPSYGECPKIIRCIAENLSVKNVPRWQRNIIPVTFYASSRLPACTLAHPFD
jgi:hypothetical protein